MSLWTKEYIKRYKRIYQKKWKLKNPFYHKIFLKKWRHRKGISKEYYEVYGIYGEKTFPNRLHYKKTNAKKKYQGYITLPIVQQVYEDNIKQYGTLTCYLCLKPILFGKDSLEHRISASRNGTNEYNNLGIAHSKCNCKKGIKTEKEYKNWLLKK